MTTSLQLGVFDIHRPAIEILIDKYNAINSLSLSVTDFTLSHPIAEVGTDYDTKISLIPSVGSIWINAKWVYYTRVSLNSIMAIPNRVQTAGNAFLYQILDAVNAAYGIYLQEADVEQAEIEYLEALDTQGPGTVTITARATSVLYKGTMTIPVNTQSRQGLNTYDDEAVYYVHVTSESPDTIKAFNIRGEEVETFTAFKGATFQVCDIDHFEMQPNGNLIVIGEFQYTTVNGFDEETEFTRKLIKLNPTGDIIDSAAGNVFGADYPSVKRVFDHDTGAMYLLDPTNYIGGRPSLIHRCNSDGTYDNNFALGLGEPASHFAIYADHLYVVRTTTGVVTVTKHNKVSGAIDSSFGPLVLTSASQYLVVYAIAVDEEGIKLVVDLADAERQASEPILLNEQPLWSEAPYSAQWSPCINFTLDGLINLENVFWQAGITHDFVGNIWQDNPLSCLASGWLVVPTVGIHPYFGTEGYNMLSFAPNGEPVRSLGLDPKQSPRWKRIHCLRRIENGDIAVCGEVETIDEYLELTTGTALALYNRLGEVSTTLVTSVESSTMFKNVFGRVP